MPIEPDSTSLEQTPPAGGAGQGPLSSAPSALRERERRSLSGHPSYPLITIGIPTRNRASLVRDCVASALAQSYQNIEVLVSDNASTDGTLAILQCINDKRVRILSSWEDLGAHENFAKCIREARGDYLVLVSDDNFLDPAFLEKCVRLAKMEPGLPIVLAAYEILVIDEFSKNERRIVPGVTSKKLSTGIWDGTDILREYLQGRISAQLFSSIIRIDILRRRDGFSMHPCAGDEATWIPALLEGRAGLVNERCASYLVHGSSYSSGVSADSRFIDLCKVMEEISAIAKHKIPDRARRLEIQKLTLRYVAYQTIITLVLYRRAGASLTDVVRKLWDWRPMLKRCTLRDFIAVLRLRSLGRILLPEPLVRWSIALGLDRLL